MLNLRAKDHTALCKIADNCFITRIEIWAYGSRVNGDSHDASDLDLVIRTLDASPLKNRELRNFR